MLPLLALVPVRVARATGWDAGRIRRMPLGLVMLYLNAVVQAEGVETTWASSADGEERSPEELARRIAQLRGQHSGTAGQ